MVKTIAKSMLLSQILAVQAAEFAPAWKLIRVTDDPKQPVFTLKADKTALSADIVKIAGIRPNDKSMVRLEGFIQSKTEGLVLLGIGADYYYELTVNGNRVWSTMGPGNSAIGGQIAADNQLQIVPVRKGKTPVSLLVRSGSCGFTVKMALYPLSLEGIQKSVNRDSSLTSAAITAGPVLTVPEKESAFILFETHGPVMATLQYRACTPSAKWKNGLGESKCGVLPCQTLHRFLLTGLKPGKKYEFRSTLLEPFAAIPGPAGTFAVPDAEQPFSFFVTTDTQIPSSDTLRMMKTYRKALKTDKCAMIVHLGDVVSLTKSYEKEYFEAFIDALNSGLPSLRPVVMVRGNHEFRGTRAGDWCDRFTSRDRKGYYGFRIGKVCFIILDSGEQRSYQGSWREPMFAAQEAYLSRQGKWLEKYIQSEDFLTADFRIVLTHAYPQIKEKFMADHLTDAAGKFFFGKNPKHKIHLWMAGHTHVYQRTFPLSDQSLLVTPQHKKVPEQCRVYVQPTEIPFTVVVGDGPEAAPVNTGFLVECGKDTLTVTVMTPEKKILDRFVINKKGKLVKSEPSKDLMIIKMKKSK